MVADELFKAGDQVPVMPLLEVVGNGVNEVAPRQIGAACVNVGVVFGLVVMVIVAVFAHNPAVGVNVYCVVAKLFIAGDQVPVTALLDVVGNAAIVAPEQTAATCVIVGVVFGLTVNKAVIVQPLLLV